MNVEPDKIFFYGGFFIVGIGVVALGLKKYLEGQRIDTHEDMRQWKEERRKPNTLLLDEGMIIRFLDSFEKHNVNEANFLTEFRHHKEIAGETLLAIKSMAEILSQQSAALAEALKMTKMVDKKADQLIQKIETIIEKVEGT